MVEDHAWRLYREQGGDVNSLPDYFVNALGMTALEHVAMMEAVQPFIDTSISKTVNVPADYPYEDSNGSSPWYPCTAATPQWEHYPRIGKKLFRV